MENYTHACKGRPSGSVDPVRVHDHVAIESDMDIISIQLKLRMCSYTLSLIISYVAKSAPVEPRVEQGSRPLINGTIYKSTNISTRFEFLGIVIGSFTAPSSVSSQSVQFFN